MKIISRLFVFASAAFLFACTQENNNTTTETASSEDLSSGVSQPQITTSIATDSGGMNQIQIVENPDAANQPTAAGMNPPHGQPGHDCAIPVGAPLNSASNTSTAPATAAPQPTISAQPQSNNTMTSPVFNAPAPTNTVADMNPPHGQPGHDCAVPVGAPLKK